MHSRDQLNALQETLDFLAQPQELEPGSLPPGLEGWNAGPFLFSSAPITAWVLGLQLLHDSSHRVVAANRKVHICFPTASACLLEGSTAASTPQVT